MNKFILYLCCFALLGCQKNFQNTKDNTLKINCMGTGIPKSFHPHLSTNFNDYTINKAVYECLTRINLKRKTEFAIAEKITISECGKKYFIRLKSTFWSNGKLLTTKHFIDAWKQAFAPNSKCIAANQFFIIKNAKKAYEGKCPLSDVGIYYLNDKEFIVELNYPTPYFLEVLSETCYAPIYDDKELEPTVFNGPFIPNEMLKKNQQILLTKNFKYWDKESVKLKNIQIYFIDDPSTAYSMYEKGKLNLIGSPLSDFPEDAISKIPNIQTCTSLAPFWLYCNTENTKLKSSKLRKALSLAIDRGEIKSSVLAFQEPNETILPKEISLIKTKKQSKIDNLKKAKELFLSALDELEIPIEKFSLTLSYCNREKHEKLAKYLKHILERNLGFKVCLKKSDWKTFISQIKSGNFEIGGYRNPAIYQDSTYFLDKFESKTQNSSKWENAEFQKYLQLARESISLEIRNQYLKQAEKILNDELPVIPIYNDTHIFTHDANLRNFIAPKISYIDFKWVYFEN
jgi:oligopeptide transport system substrate-binding protein